LPERRWRFVPLWGIPTWFLYAPRRVECAEHGIVVEQIPWSAGKRPVTRAMMGFLARWARRLSWRETAQVFQTSWEAVYRSVEWFVEWGLAHRILEGIRAIGIDEIHWGQGKGANAFLTVIYQIDGHCRRLLWLGPKRTQATLRRGLAALGPVNPLALEELSTLEERHKELEAQVDDVRGARRELHEVVRTLDHEIMTSFAAAAADVNEHFSVLIAMLFPGGTGRLMLVDPDDLLNTGVEIEVRPAGRNVRRVSLLSGGERSMAALAFLFAVFRSRPSPFYMMDEVEAALDDALKALIATNLFDHVAIDHANDRLVVHLTEAKVGRQRGRLQSRLLPGPLLKVCYVLRDAPLRRHDQCPGQLGRRDLHLVHSPVTAGIAALAGPARTSGGCRAGRRRHREPGRSGKRRKTAAARAAAEGRSGRGDVRRDLAAAL